MERRFQGNETPAAKLRPVGGTAPITLPVEHWADVAFTKSLESSESPAFRQRPDLPDHARQDAPFGTPSFVPAFQREQVNPVAPAA